MPVSLSQTEAVSSPLFSTSFNDESIQWPRELEEKRIGEPFSLKLKSGRGSASCWHLSPEETTALVKNYSHYEQTAAIMLHMHNLKGVPSTSNQPEKAEILHGGGAQVLQHTSL